MYTEIHVLLSSCLVRFIDTILQLGASQSKAAETSPPWPRHTLKFHRIIEAIKSDPMGASCTLSFRVKSNVEILCLKFLYGHSTATLDALIPLLYDGSSGVDVKGKNKLASMAWARMQNLRKSNNYCRRQADFVKGSRPFHYCCKESCRGISLLLIHEHAENVHWEVW
jgi:hypothetical protein